MKPYVYIQNLYLRRNESFRLHIKECSAKSGAITCITGPNGGGKSTFIEIVMGLLQPDSGSVQINGSSQKMDVQQMRAHIGYVPDDENWFIKELCAQEYFELLADVYRRAGSTIRLSESWRQIAERLELTALATPIQELSHGNKKKVQIVAALMHHPKLIVVDELRNGLDPIAIMTAEQLLREQAAGGSCIIAATHDLWWAERVADCVLLITSGVVSAQLTVSQIRKKYGSVETMFMALAHP